MLKLAVDSLETVEEAYRPLYLEKDGKFHLDADIEDTSALKAKNADLVVRLKTASGRAALLGDRSPEEVQADIELAAKYREEKAKVEGDLDSFKTQMAAQYTAAIAKKDGRIAKVEGKMFDVMAKREVESAITAAGGNAKVLLPHILPLVRVTEQDDDFGVEVVDAKGNPRIADGQATPMTIAQLVETFKADANFGDNFKGSGMSGGGATTTTAQRTGGGAVVIPKDASVTEYRRLKAEAEKRGVPYSVAS